MKYRVDIRGLSTVQLVQEVHLALMLSGREEEASKFIKRAWGATSRARIVELANTLNTLKGKRKNR